MNSTGGMVDVGDKKITVRVAKAEGYVKLGDDAFEIIKNGTCIKGDVLATARIAAIQAVKATPSMIPLCHSILIEAVKVEFAMLEEDSSVSVTVKVKSSGKTGVEMEALAGVSVACLTIYDMLKYTGKAMTIDQIKLLEKTGGKSGNYKRSN